MQTKTKIIIFGVLALSACLAVASFWLTTRCQHFAWRTVKNAFLGKAEDTSEIEFREIMAAHGTDPSGNTFNSSRIISSDCLTLEKSQERFTSEMEAKEAMKRKIKNMYRVVEHDETTQDDGSLTERFVVLLSPKEDRVLIVRQNGLAVMSIESPSLRHALAYEKRCCR